MRLSIAEGYYLIALDDEEGRVLAAAEKKVIPGVVSAGLLELHLLKKVKFSGNTISALGKVGTGNGILDNIMKRLEVGKPIVDNLKSVISKYKEIMEDLNSLLAQRGILQREETKLLWIPLSERMDNANYAFEKEIRYHLKMIVLKGAKPSPAYALLFALIESSNILEEVFKNPKELAFADSKSESIIEKSELDQDLRSNLKDILAFIGSH